MDYYHMKPQEIRKLISEEKITGPTAGMSGGYAQANLVIIPKKYAYDFLLFTRSNGFQIAVSHISYFQILSDSGSRRCGRPLSENHCSGM